MSGSAESLGDAGLFLSTGSSTQERESSLRARWEANAGPAGTVPMLLGSGPAGGRGSGPRDGVFLEKQVLLQCSCLRMPANTT